MAWIVFTMDIILAGTIFAVAMSAGVLVLLEIGAAHWRSRRDRIKKPRACASREMGDALTNQVRDPISELKMNPVKTLLVLLATCGLLLASQRPAQAQVSWGIPLPFPFLFYNFNQGYYSQQLSYGQRAYYSQGYHCRPGYCTHARHAYFNRGYYRPYYRPRYYYEPAWPQSYYGPGWGGYGGW
jgi:hypothetical protein